MESIADPSSSTTPYHSLPIGIQFSSRGLTAPLLQSDAEEGSRRRSSPLRPLMLLAALLALALLVAVMLPSDHMPRPQDSLGLIEIAGDQADGRWGCKYALLDVIFAKSRANCGNFVRSKDLQQLPSVSFPDADDGQLYAVAVVDVSARGGEYRQLLLGNVPGPTLRDGNLSLAGVSLTPCALADRCRASPSPARAASQSKPVRPLPCRTNPPPLPSPPLPLLPQGSRQHRTTTRSPRGSRCCSSVSTGRRWTLRRSRAIAVLGTRSSGPMATASAPRWRPTTSGFAADGGGVGETAPRHQNASQLFFRR